MSSTVTGVLKLGKKGSGGVLRQIQHSFRPQGRETEVPEGIIREYRLVEGAQLTGRARPSRQGSLLTDIESVCGTTPEQFQRRRPYTALTAIDPHERFNLAASGDDVHGAGAFDVGTALSVDGGRALTPLRAREPSGSARAARSTARERAGSGAPSRG